MKRISLPVCGRRSDRIKAHMGRRHSFSFTKRLELGSFSWPRTKEEALEITGTIPGTDAGLGDRVQTSNPGSAAQ